MCVFLRVVGLTIVSQDNEVLEGVNLSENKLQCGADLASFLDVDAFFFPQLAFSRRIGK